MRDQWPNWEKLLARSFASRRGGLIRSGMKLGWIWVAILSTLLISFGWKNMIIFLRFLV